MLHPLLAAMLVVDITGAILVGYAGVGAFPIALGWTDGATNRSQLRLERLGERVVALGRFGLWWLNVSTVLFVIAVSGVLPELVPGAMCGEGVFQNLGGAGGRVLLSRGAAVAVLAAWHLVVRLDGTVPVSPLMPVAARLQILSVPLVGVSSVYLFNAALAFDISRPVDCCATVLVEVARTLATSGSTSSTRLAVATSVLGIALVSTAVTAFRYPTSRWPCTLTAGLSTVFVPLAGRALLHVFAPYHFGVLAHHCAWCLFLGEHHYVGWPLFASLVMVAADGPALLIAHTLGRRYAPINGVATRRIRAGAVRLVAAMGVYAVLTYGVALMWRLRFGLWMTG